MKRKSTLPGLDKIFPFRLYLFSALLLTVGLFPVRGGENLFPDPEFQKTEDSSLWSLPDSAVCEEDNAAVLKTWRTDPEKFMPLASCSFPIEPGYYRVCCEMRGEDLANGQATFAIELSDAHGKDVNGGVSAAGITGNASWKEIETVLVVPPHTNTASWFFYLRRGCTGTAYFRKPVLERLETNFISLLRPVAPSQLSAGPHKFIFGVNGDSLSARIKWDEESPEDLPIEDYRLSFERELAAGLHHLTVTLEPSGRAYSYEFTAVAPEAAEKYPVRLDDQGRTWVNGRKFFPLGLYDHSSDPRNGKNYPDFPELVKILAASPFNCLMPYEVAPFSGRGFGMRGTGKEGFEAIQDALDEFERNGLKIIFSLKDFRGPECSWWGVKGEENILREAVSRYKNHPALLAWYLIDEDLITKRAHNLERRELINRLDPGHPTWAVFCDFSKMNFYAGLADVYGVDPYPIGNTRPVNQKAVAHAFDISDRSFGHDGELAMWSVPQIFSWAMYSGCPDGKIPEDKPYPSLQEMRSMVLLELIRGAKGLLMYSFHDLFTGPDAEQFNRRWPEICQVAEMAGKVSDYILGDEPGPDLQWEKKDSSLYARGFQDDNGKQVILLSALGPETAEAIFRIDSPKKFRSEFGRTIQEPDGSYHFTGTGIDSDILWEE